MIESIDHIRGVGLRRALIGLAIPMASEAAATRLCRAGYGSLEDVADAGEEALRRSATSARRSPPAGTPTSTARPTRAEEVAECARSA